MQKPLQLRFKGQRDYLHGTDILNSTLAYLHEENGSQHVSGINFTFHRMARTAVLLKDKNSLAPMDMIAAECSYCVEGNQAKVFICETSEAITGRYPYDEELICQDYKINAEEKSGILTGCPPFTDIEIWVALTKALHERVLPEIKGKWLFVKALLPSYAKASEVSERRLRIVSNFQNKLTRTELHGDGKKAGEIFFSVI